MFWSKMPATNTAVVGLEDGSLALRHNLPLPALEDDTILVRNRAVALNPIDTKMVGTPGAVAGMDFAGEVLAIGAKAQTATPLKVGDRVCGAVPGMHSLTPRVGAFAAVVASPDVTTLKIPDTVSFQEGASLGSGVGTIGLALFRSLQVPGSPLAPADKVKGKPVDVLVYGGSTATGTLALQLLKLSGLNPIATCSPHNFDLVRSYGAAEVFDYRSETCAEDIRRHTRNSLKFVLDCISEPETMQLCYACLGRAGGRYTALEPYPEFLHTRPRTVTPDWVLGPVVLGKKLGWPEPFGREGDPAAREFAVGWFRTAQALLSEGRLRTHPLRVLEGGLGSVTDGLELLRKKQVSGQKLIYNVSDGPANRKLFVGRQQQQQQRGRGPSAAAIASKVTGWGGKGIKMGRAAYLSMLLTLLIALRGWIVPMVLASQSLKMRAGPMAAEGVQKVAGRDAVEAVVVSSGAED